MEGSGTQVLLFCLDSKKIASVETSKKMGGGGGVLPYMGYIGVCHCEGYGFQAVYSSIGHINQSVWIKNRVLLIKNEKKINKKNLSHKTLLDTIN